MGNMFDSILNAEEEDKKDKPSSMFGDILDPTPQNDIDPHEQRRLDEIEKRPTIPEPQNVTEALKVVNDTEPDVYAFAQDFWNLYNGASDVQEDSLGLHGFAGTGGLVSPDPAKQAGEGLVTKQIEAFKMAYEYANLGVEQGELGYKTLIGTSTDADIARLKEIDARHAEIMKIKGEDITISNAMGTLAPYFVKSAQEGGKGALVGAMAGGVVGAILGNLIPGFQFLPEEALTVPGGALAGAKVGGVFGSAEAIRKIEAGHAFLDMSKDPNIDPNAARVAAHSIGAINGGLEAVQFKMLGRFVPKGLMNKVALKTTTEFFKMPAVRKILVKSGTTLGAETGVEVLQELNTLYIESFAKNFKEDEGIAKAIGAGISDVSGAEVVKTIKDTSELMIKGLGPFAFLSAGANVALMPEGSAVKEAADNMQSDKETIEAQDIKTPDVKADEKTEPQSQVRLAGNGKMIVSLNTVQEAQAEEKVFDQGTPASKESNRAASALGIDDHVSVQKRNLTGETESTENAQKQTVDAGKNVLDETRGTMEIQLHSHNIETDIRKDEGLEFEYRDAIQNNDPLVARDIAVAQMDNIQKLTTDYDSLAKSQEVKAKAQKVEPNPKIQEAFANDTMHRTNRAKKNLDIANNNIQTQARQQNQALLDQLEQPETHRDLMWAEGLRQKNQGNSEGAKIYDRLVKEFNVSENLGEFNYMDKVNVNKISDMKTDVQSYMSELTPGSREERILDKAVSRLDELILNKRQWDVKKGLADIESAELEKEQAAKAKKGTATKAKPSPVAKKAETVAKAQKAKRQAKAETGLKKKVAEVRAKKAAVSKQKQQLREPETKLKRAVAKSREAKAKRLAEIREDLSRKAAIKKQVAEVEGLERPKTPIKKGNVTVKDLKKDDTNFVILTPDNPNSTQVSDKVNAANRAKLKSKLDALGIDYTVGTSKFEGMAEVPFVIHNMSKAEGKKLSDELGQSSFIYAQGKETGLVEGAKVNKGTRASIKKAPDATDYFTKIGGEKFTMDFDFDTAVDFDALAELSPKGAVNVFRFPDGKILEGATSGEIYNKANLTQRKQMQSGEAVEGFRSADGKIKVRYPEKAESVGIEASELTGSPESVAFKQALTKATVDSKRNPWLPIVKLAKNLGTKFKFVESKADLKDVSERSKSMFQIARALYAHGTDKVYVNVNGMLKDRFEKDMARKIDKGVRTMAHESLHSVVRHKLIDKSVGGYRVAMRQLGHWYDSIPESNKQNLPDPYDPTIQTFVSQMDANRVKLAEAEGKSDVTGIDQALHNHEEIITWAFTSPQVASWLNNIPATAEVKAPGKTFWEQLKNIILRVAGVTVKDKSKLAELSGLMNDILPDKAIRFAKAKGKATGVSPATVIKTTMALDKKFPKSAKSKVVTTEDKLPKQLQLSKQAKDAGTIIKSVWDEDSDSVYFVAENFESEAEILKKYLHENVAHKGLRNIFPNKAQFNKFLNEARGVLLKAGKAQELNDVSVMYNGKSFVAATAKQKYEVIEEYLALNFAEKLDTKTRKGLLTKLMDMLKRWLPANFFDKKAAQAGEILTMDDLNTVMEAAKHNIMNKQPKLTAAIVKAFADRAPREPSAITDKVKFQKTVPEYAKMVQDVMKELPEAKQWYPAHIQRLEKVFGRDGLLFNLLLSITSPQSSVVENVGHAVDTYLYMLGKKEKPGGLYWPQVQEKVDAWTDQEAVLKGIGGQFKINEFVRGLLGDKDATVLDIWMHRLFFGADHKAPGQESFVTSENQAGRQILFDISKHLEQETGEQWSPRDVQAVLWTYIKAKQEGTSFADVPNFETGFIEPRVKYEGRTALEELFRHIDADSVFEGPLSDKLGMTGFEPTALSRMEKSRLLQLSRISEGAKLKEITPKGKENLRKFTTEDGSAKYNLNTETGEIQLELGDSKIQGVGTELVVDAIKNGGNHVWVAEDHMVDFYEMFGFAEDPTQQYEDRVRMYMPEFVRDTFRNKNGKVTPGLVRESLGGSTLDLQPRREHRYSLAKIQWQESEETVGPDGQPNFLNKLFEWKDQADLNIQRAVVKLEQEFLAEFGGRKWTGKLPGTAGYLRNTAATRLLQKGMNLYIDSGPQTKNYQKVLDYKEYLESKKRTAIEQDRLNIINRMIELSDNEKAWADNNVRPWYEDTYQLAKDAEVIDSYVDGYVRRAWSIPKGEIAGGARVGDNTTASFSNFKLTTERGKTREFSSIIDGWRQGPKWKLRNDALLNNLQTYLNEINEVVTNKRFMEYMKEMVDENGEGLIQVDISKRKASELGMERVNARGFGSPFQEVYARSDIAQDLNKATSDGAHGFWNVPGLKFLQRMNAWIKGSVLSLSAFHHVAGVRSWEFGVNKNLKLNPIRAYKDGLKKIENRVEYDIHGYKLGPVADYLIKHGLTIGKIQDWDNDVLRQENSLIENWLAGTTASKSALVKQAIELKKKGRRFRENWTRSLFGRLFAGLKVEAGSMELAHNIKSAERKKGAALTEAELAELGRKTARVINADFGGLHLKRMGRNTNLQKFAQMLLLAPDWTESNFRTITGAMGMNGLINKVIGDFKAPAGMGSFYRKFWFGIMWKLAATYGLATAATMAVGDDDDRKTYVDLLTKSFSSFEDFSRAKWTQIPLDPWLNKIPGRQKSDPDEWSGFRMGGHFFDVLKIMEPDKLIKHKASPLIRQLATLGTGTDWKGAPLMGVSDWLKGDTGIVSDNPFERERNFFDRLPATALYEIRGAMPIFLQEGLRLWQGETQALEALRAGGVDIRPMGKSDVSLDEFTEIKTKVNAVERGIKDARKIKDKQAIKDAKAKRVEEFGSLRKYNKVKSQLGYAKAKLRRVNSKIRVFEIKEKLGKELSDKEQQKLTDLKAQKQKIVDRFLEVTQRSR